MPQTSYCKSCGGKTISDTSPIYCSKCGCPFISTSIARSVTAPKKVIPFKQEEDDDDNYTDVTSVPSLENVTYEVNFDENISKGTTLGSILEQNKGKPVNKKKGKQPKTAAKPRGTGKSKEQILADFRRENESKPIEID
jgi:hypothetical protein